MEKANRGAGDDDFECGDLAAEVVKPWQTLEDEAVRQWRREQYEQRQKELATGICSHDMYIGLCPCCSSWA
jgi:hypothetical protein